MPIVGTDDKTCGNRIPDKYSYTVTATNGEKQPVSGSFWRDYACSLPEGKQESETIAKIKARAADKAGQKQTNRLQLLRHEARLESVVRVVRTAVRVMQQFDRINSECGPVKALHHFVWTRDDKGREVRDNDGSRIPLYSSSKAPIYIGSTETGPEAADEWDFYSVSQMLSMKADAAKAAGGGFSALVATMKRPPKGKDGELPAVELKNFVDYATNFERFVTEEGNDVALRKVLDSGKADDLLMTLADLSDALVALLDPYTTARGGKPAKITALRNAIKAAETKLTEGKQEKQKKAN